MGTGRSGLYPSKDHSLDNSSKNNKSSILSNANNMRIEYPRTQSGYFGVKGKNHRVIESNNPVETSKDFYEKIGHGGKTTDLPNGKGTKTVLDDGTVIVHRIITSTNGSPAIEISVSGSDKIKNQKIHFIKEDTNDK